MKPRLNAERSGDCNEAGPGIKRLRHPPSRCTIIRAPNGFFPSAFGIRIQFCGQQRLSTKEQQTRTRWPEQEPSQNILAYDLGLADRIQMLLGRAGNLSKQKMSCDLCFMVEVHMWCGILKSDLMLCLTPRIAEASLHEPHTRPMDLTGRRKKSMICIDAFEIDSDTSLERWVRFAEKVARSLPGKPAGQ